MSQATAEPITVYADYVCPFCYLGRESLDRYQDQRNEPLRIDWHPFDLRAQKRGPDGEKNPDVADGKDESYYATAGENVERLQDEYDVDMTLDIATDVDSLDAQVASFYVKQEYDYDQWLAFDEAVYDALWQDGRDIGDPDVLADVATEVGLDPEEIRDAIDDEELRATIQERFQAAHDRRITGVPTFVYDDYVARGAVPPEQLERLVEGV